MSSLHSGQWRCYRGRSGRSVALIAAVLVFFAPAAPDARDDPDFFLPDLEPYALLMAELVEAEVTFIDPTGIGAVNDLQFGLPGQNLATIGSMTVSPDNGEGGTKRNILKDGPQTAANLTVAAAPGQPITIPVDEVVPGTGYSLADFRCSDNAGNDRACDGPGYFETAVRNGTLLVGVTVTGNSTTLSGAADGSFDVTIS